MRRFLLLTLVTAFLAQTVLAIDRPDPPVGFTWQEIPELKAALLRPDGWYYKREESKGALAYFITKESIAKGGEFQTGLTVNVFRRRKDSAVDTAKLYIDKVSAQYHAEKWAKTVGPFEEFGCLSKVTDSTGTTVTQSLMVANPKTNTLYLVIFESPESNWETAWAIGKQIMDQLALDDET